jgi:hypothetical protein
MYNDVYFLMRKSFEFFSLNGCNSTIASNKQRQGHNNLTTIWRLERKTRGIPRALEEPPTCPRRLEPKCKLNPHKNGQRIH